MLKEETIHRILIQKKSIPILAGKKKKIIFIEGKEFQKSSWKKETENFYHESL